MSQEVTYYSDGSIQITSARAVLEGKTYVMANITSVSIGKIPADRMSGIVTAAFGLLALLFAFVLPVEVGEAKVGCFLLGLLFVIGGLVVAYFAKTKYIVKIGSASGESDALSSFDQGYIDKIVNAINEAIIKRG